MLANLGLFCLILTAVISSCGAAVGLYSLSQSKQIAVLAVLSRSFSNIVFLFAGLSLLLLSYAFATDDFSLSYVSDNSNSALALPFKIAATWGGHQGSMLFWVAIIAGWAVLVSRKNNSVSDFHASWLMLVLVSIFSWFTLLASNPFTMNEVLPLEGRDLNPMLQDIGLIIHPPLLYVGYVGFASVLALTCGYLIEAKAEGELFERLTRHTLLAWVFLSAGIILGAGWAYYELGWGGWWFWDPVENASLLPWLTATALVHSVIASRKQGQLKLWTFSLAIVTFCLSILGTFIVRSGVLTSVHAFAVDPSKGLTLLGILSLVFISAYVLLINRAASIKSNTISGFSSKNTFILWALNLFVLATAIVLLGTFYPMLYQLFGLGNISVGAPYFNLLFAPLTIIALTAMALSPLLKWQAKSGDFPRKLASITVSVSGFLSLVFIHYYTNQDSEVAATWSTYAFITTWVATWLIVTHVLRCLRVRKKEYRYKIYLVSIAHIGVALLAFGASMNSYYSYELTAKLGPKSSVQFGDYNINYQQTELYVAPNFTAEQAVIEITDNSGNSLIARPEKRHYPVRVMNMTEPSLTPYWNGDVYITLGEKLDPQHYAVRIQFKAFIRWIGMGGLLVVFAGIGLLVRGVLVKQFNPRSKRAITRRYQT
ncbi:heme lyase CcmF/NrfE family subunit [Vibrio comitans]|uniref:C-type cytochrome biogenesis protein CcmF n=1 Tax=Vibrio comitans NBRC 102076 TaxID=1219078 RepID=A0A4Y3IRU6_9VIBR|nr:heme lyase CcmF/NrfE family subunit [Vibrio comitans]GEA62233.1 c-type cytochrome biogenesis protein CcmF [Vibrio comitans NBRC 102076]